MHIAEWPWSKQIALQSCKWPQQGMNSEGQTSIEELSLNSEGASLFASRPCQDIVDLCDWQESSECRCFRERWTTINIVVEQRWANSVLRTEYEYEYYSSSKKWPNTNTNIIRFEKITRIRIRILFGLKKSPEYEYEYYSVWKYQPNTNTNILVFEYYSNNIRIPNYSLTSGIKACKGTLLCSKTKYKGI